jgi:hypothetical protein
MRNTLAVVAALVLVSGARARAQEEPAPAPAQADEQESAQSDEARPHIQVLQHPYEISSFYRSSQSSGFDLGYEPEGGSEKYPIAGFYRSHGGSRGAYSMFWTTGYGSGAYGSNGGNGRMWRGRVLGAPRTRALGLNGDLCLFAPFLAPVGPLSGVFFDK